jgi:hypothetical protein
VAIAGVATESFGLTNAVRYANWLHPRNMILQSAAQEIGQEVERSKGKP